jgi:hypothetical protein
VAKITLPLVGIGEFGNDDATLAAGFRWRLVGERRAGGDKVAAVAVHGQGNDIAALATAVAIPDLFLGVDRETVNAAAHRTRPDALHPVAVQLDIAPRNLILDTHAARRRNPGLERGVAHDAPS